MTKKSDPMMKLQAMLDNANARVGDAIEDFKKEISDAVVKYKNDIPLPLMAASLLFYTQLVLKLDANHFPAEDRTLQSYLDDLAMLEAFAARFIAAQREYYKKTK